MAITQVSRSRAWDQRIERAQILSERYPAAVEVLSFYRQIAMFQKTIFDQLAANGSPKQMTSSLRELIDVEGAARHLPELIGIVEQTGTETLKDAAHLLKARPSPELLAIFECFALDKEWEAGPDGFFARVCLQPYAEQLAAERELPPGFSGVLCPHCSGKPQLAVLRPEGDGGKRFLLCSFCITEWEFRRVLCPVCAEVDHQKLPRYTADGMGSVRVEACDTCKHYLKSVDLTVEGLAVPIVDELATVPLDLWAIERGYEKLHQNVLGF